MIKRDAPAQRTQRSVGIVKEAFDEEAVCKRRTSVLLLGLWTLINALTARVRDDAVTDFALKEFG
jgi:hypothetical protein